MTDQEIIIQCLEGNPQPFETLVKRYQKNVLMTAVSITGNLEEAEDIAQESFIKAFSKLFTFNQRANFKNWLLAITFKTGIDFYRRHKSFKKYVDILKDETSVHSNGPGAPLEESELFAPYLRLLNYRERTAISLQMNENFSAAEISKVINCSVSTVRVHLFSARKKIRKRMDEELPNENYVLD